MSDPSLATVESTTVPDAESSAAVAASMAQAEALATAAAVDAMASAVAAATAEAMATPPAATAKRTRSTNLTHEQKRLICLYAKQHPTATQAQLGKWAQAQFSLACVPSQSSISHTLKKRHAFEHMKSEDWSSKRLRTVKYPELDTALANWFLYCQARQVRIQGDEIKAKAQLFFELLQLDVQATGSAEPPQFSNGWLHSFQSRHGFSRSPNTHPHSSDHELITSRAELVEATRAFAPWDVFWMDETKLSIALDPHGFGDEAEAEANAVDRQMTVAFCCNTDGSELLDPFFICDGPLDFGATSDSPAAATSATAASSAASHAVEYGFTYAYNKKIWMTPTLFREWLLSFDWKMHEENRHVVLLLDAFSSHQVKKLTLKNVTVRFVAQTPFGESYLDSVEHTLLAAVKRRYRRLHLTGVVAGKEDLSPPINYDVSVVQAIQWVLASWRDVPRALVADAFAQVGLPTTDELTAATSSTTTTTTTPASVLETEQQVEAELTVLLTTKLQVKPPIRLSEFISPVSERILDEDFTDQDFVDCAMDSCLSTAVAGRNAEPPRKIARVSRVTKPKPFHGGAGGFAARGLGAGRPPTAAMRMVSADDLTAASAVPDEEWQAWADSQRFRIDELHALETVVRLAAEMNCEPTTMVDLARMQAELMQKRQPAAAGGVLAAGATPTDVAAATDGKQAASVCRFNFGAGSTVV